MSALFATRDSSHTYLPDGLPVWRPLPCFVFSKDFEKQACGLPGAASSQDKARRRKVLDDVHLFRGQFERKFFTVGRLHDRLEKWLSHVVIFACMTHC